MPKCVEVGLEVRRTHADAFVVACVGRQNRCKQFIWTFLSNFGPDRICSRRNGARSRVAVRREPTATTWSCHFHTLCNKLIFKTILTRYKEKMPIMSLKYRIQTKILESERARAVAMPASASAARRNIRSAAKFFASPLINHFSTRHYAISV